MKSKIIWVMVFVLACGLSGVVGAFVGAKSLLVGDVGTYVTALNGDLAVIKLLKINQKDKAEELLEDMIDHYVSYLGEQAKDELYAKSRNDIIEVIHKARAYRSRIPGSKHVPEPSLKNSVDTAFKL
jgi:parvulin-like peptidyl-prolyl isomerase